MRLRLVIACALVAASPVAADDRALVIGMQTDDAEGEPAISDDIEGAVAALEAAGFDVASGVDPDIDALRAGLASLVTDVAPDRSVILLTGRFANAGASGWFLSGAAEAPSLADVDGTALSLGTVMEVAARSPGGAVVLLGSVADPPADPDAGIATDSEDAPPTLGTGLMPGPGLPTPPQGVTVIQGAIPDILGFAEELLVTPGLSLPEMLEVAQGLDLELAAQGFLAPRLPFLPAADAAPEDEEADTAAAAAERAVWQGAQDTGTVVAYEAYLARFPDGRFAADARRAIDQLAEDPERIEAALGLGADARRQVQRDLTVLGHDTRGVDGIFGPGTRGAISNWQEASGLEATGFVTAEQIDILRQMAVTRTAEVEEEARQQQLDRERADRAYWEDIGRGQDEAGLRAYLDRFPDGVFSDVANARLSEITARRDRAAWESAQAEDTEAAYRAYLDAQGDGAYAGRARARLAEMGAADQLAADEAAWATAQQADIADAYARYLEAFPEGEFAATAAARLSELTAQEAPADAEMSQQEARAAEAALGLGPLARSLVEAQLLAQGFDPGRIDGQFDSDTRAALHSYQQARGLPQTGHVDRDTLNRMVADGLPLPR